jgi:hypothetical protein
MGLGESSAARSPSCRRLRLFAFRSPLVVPLSPLSPPQPPGGAALWEEDLRKGAPLAGRSSSSPSSTPESNEEPEEVSLSLSRPLRLLLSLLLSTSMSAFGSSALSSALNWREDCAYARIARGKGFYYWASCYQGMRVISKKET